MKQGNVSMSHPVTAANKRLPRAQQILEESSAVFEKAEAEKEAARPIERKPITASAPITRNLKELLFFGTLSERVELGGFTFELKTLNNAKSREISRRWVMLDDAAKQSMGNLMLLASSLVSINDICIADAYSNLFEAEPLESEMDMNLEILSSLNSHLVGVLISKYLELSAKSSNLLTPQAHEKDSESVENLG